MNKKYKITYKFIFQKKSKLWVKIKQFYVVRELRDSKYVNQNSQEVVDD